MAYSGLVALVAGLGYLTFRSVGAHRNTSDADSEVAEPAQTSFIDLDSFVTRHEKSSDADRLSVSLRLRMNAPGGTDCHIYFLARNDRVSPRLWAVWPPQEPGGAVTAGGHFRGGTPSTGTQLTLTPKWTRVTGSFDHPPGQPPFEMVIVYVVGAHGEILLARPFAL